MANVNVGSVTISNGSATLTGVGTDWLTSVQPFISQANKPALTISAAVGGDGAFYEVSSVGSDTSITLVSTYGGATISTGVAYNINIDYTAKGFDEIGVGDKNAPGIITRAIRKIDTYLGNVLSGAQAFTSLTTDKLTSDSLLLAAQSPDSEFYGVSTPVAAKIYITGNDSDPGWIYRQDDKTWEREVGESNGIWLGAYSAAPSARPDGTAIQGGDVYWDTTSTVYKKYIADNTLYIGEHFGDSDGTWNTTTRGVQKQVPSVTALLLQSGKLSVFDYTKETPIFWRSWSNGASTTFGTATFTSVDAKDGKIILGTSAGVFIIDLVTDEVHKYDTTGHYVQDGVITTTTSELSTVSTATTSQIGNNTINDVAITVRPDSPIDQLRGMPRPTWGASTEGGVPVYNGLVDAIYKDTAVSTSNNTSDYIDFVGDKVVFATRGNVAIRITDIPTADVAAAQASDIIITRKGIPVAGTAIVYEPSMTQGVTGISNVDDNVFTFSSGDGLFYADISSFTADDIGVVDLVTNSFFLANHGDLQRFYQGFTDTIANAAVDRSIKDATLTNVGSLTVGAVATNAHQFGVSGYSASAYQNESVYSSELDPGTGKIEINFWLKEEPNSATEYIFCRDSNTTAQRYYAFINSSGNLVFGCDDNTTDRTATSSLAIDDGVWHRYSLQYDGAGTLNAYLDDGNLIATATGAALLTLNNASAILRIGVDCAAAPANPLTNGTTTLFSIATSNSTVAEIKRAYRLQKELFKEGAVWKLGNASVVKVAYDFRKDLVIASTNAGTYWYKGLTQTRSETGASWQSLSALDYERGYGYGG
jgi:hypothetical protein